MGTIKRETLTSSDLLGLQLYVSRFPGMMMRLAHRCFLPPPVLDVLSDNQVEVAERAAMITTALKWILDHLPHVDLTTLLPLNLNGAQEAPSRLELYRGLHRLELERYQGLR